MLHERFHTYLPLFDAFEKAGHQLFFVGGCVRDLVMGDRQIGDVDLATSAPVEDTKRVLIDAGFPSHPIGERFGTITTIVEGVAVEITTFRVAESYEAGSRHPEVVFGENVEADLSRRDLSMNAMAMDRQGTIIDPFDGRGAIRDRRLEVPGAGYENTLTILRDDPLRLLRIARFAARFGYAPTEETTRAAQATAEELRNISCERWKMEMDKLLVADAPEVGLEWLCDVGALPVILPSLDDLCQAGTARALGERLRTTLPDTTLRWAGLLLGGMRAPDDAVWIDDALTDDELPARDQRTQLAEEVARAFRFSNAERARLGRLMSTPLTAAVVRGSAPEPDLRRWYVAFEEDCFGQLILAQAMCDDAGLDTAIERRRRALLSLLDREDPVPKLPSGFGHALGSSLGLRGPAIGAAMERVREGILDGELPNGALPELYLDYLREQQ